jgi:hypothetical protein
MPSSELHTLIATLESCADHNLYEADRHRRRSDYLRCAANALRNGDEAVVFDTLFDLEEFCWNDPYGSEISQAVTDCYAESSGSPDEPS